MYYYDEQMLTQEVLLLCIPTKRHKSACEDKYKNMKYDNYLIARHIMIYDYKSFYILDIVISKGSYFPRLKGCITVTLFHSLNLPDCSSCFIICFYLPSLFIHITLIIHQKPHCVNILRKHQQSTLQYHNTLTHHLSTK